MKVVLYRNKKGFSVFCLQSSRHLCCTIQYLLAIELEFESIPVLIETLAAASKAAALSQPVIPATALSGSGLRRFGEHCGLTDIGGGIGVGTG